MLLFSDSCHRTGEQIRLDVLASEANSLDRRAAAIFQSFAKEIARCERASDEELPSPGSRPRIIAGIAALLILIILSAAGWYIGHHRNGSPKATQTKKGVLHQPVGDGRDKARPAPIAKRIPETQTAHP